MDGDQPSIFTADAAQSIFSGAGDQNSPFWRRGLGYDPMWDTEKCIWVNPAVLMFGQGWEETETCRRTPAKVTGEVEEKQGRKAAGGIRKS